MARLVESAGGMRDGAVATAQIVRTIDGIAFQANLLAANAEASPAARARPSSGRPRLALAAALAGRQRRRAGRRPGARAPVTGRA
jgi:hypothetical protein